MSSTTNPGERGRFPSHRPDAQEELALGAPLLATLAELVDALREINGGPDDDRTTGLPALWL